MGEVTKQRRRIAKIPISQSTKAAALGKMVDLGHPVKTLETCSDKDEFSVVGEQQKGALRGT